MTPPDKPSIAQIVEHVPHQQENAFCRRTRALKAGRKPDAADLYCSILRINITERQPSFGDTASLRQDGKEGLIVPSCQVDDVRGQRSPGRKWPISQIGP